MEEATRRFPEIKAQLGEEEQAKCPRCESRFTKFCYYNNYNLSQPRHFCKNCRRYWTKGGALRNIPVGGGTRKNNAKRPKRPNPEAAASPTGVIDPDRRELDTGGSFSSVMGGGQFGNFLDGSGLKMDGFGGEGSGNSNNNSGLDLEGSGNSNKEGYLESGDWESGTGWPDLAICTPGSTFQ